MERYILKLKLKDHTKKFEIDYRQNYKHHLLLFSSSELSFKLSLPSTTTSEREFGWNLPPNTTFFSNWARNKTFSAGDKLVFRSKANEMHDVAEPNSEADFDGCVKPGIVFSTSAVFSVALDGPGRRYFICTIGNHCNAGMKFGIDVLAQPGAPNPLVPPPPPSSASSLRFGALLAALAGVLLTIVA